MSDTFSFTNASGRTVTLRKIRRLATDRLVTMTKYTILEGDELDLIAARIYGPGNEHLRTLIIEKNISKLLDNGFLLSAMVGEELEIPSPDQATRIQSSVTIPNVVSFDDL